MSHSAIAENETSKNIITLTVNGEDIRFAPCEAVYNRLINEMSESNKIAPAKNFLVRSVLEQDAEILQRLLNKPGMALHLATVLNQEYAGEITVTVKK